MRWRAERRVEYVMERLDAKNIVLFKVADETNTISTG